MTFKLERLGGVAVERLVVYGDSGVDVSPLAPARLELEPVLPRGPVHRGDDFPLAFRLRNAGDRTARDVVVGVEAPMVGVQVRGRDIRRFPTLKGTASGVFRFRATAAGQYRLVLGATAANANRPAAEIAVPVRSAPAPTGLSSLLRALTGVVLLVAGIVLVVGLRHRSRG